MAVGEIQKQEIYVWPNLMKIKSIILGFAFVAVIYYVFGGLIADDIRSSQISNDFDYKSPIFFRDRKFYVDLNKSGEFFIEYNFYRRADSALLKNPTTYSFYFGKYGGGAFDFEGKLRIRLSFKKGTYFKNEDCKGLGILNSISKQQRAFFVKDEYGNSYTEFDFNLKKETNDASLMTFYGCRGRFTNVQVFGKITNYPPNTTFLFIGGGD